MIYKLCLYFVLLISVSKTYKLKKNAFNREFRNKIDNLEYIDKDKRKDYEYILNYKGTSIEPEWEWVKNISFVYTWVDGSDIDLSYIKSKYNGGNRKVDSRFRSADELRYSLRSLKKYLPWHNGKIFIVTDNQIPDWLDINNNNIKNINHQEIIPKYINPTYDSSTIECFLDKIPGIGEIFIYLNDDFFFNNFVHPAFFFSSETFYPKIFRTKEEVINIENVENFIKENNIHYIYGASVYFTYEIIRKYFDRNFIYYHLAHSAYVCYRSFFEPFRQFFQNELKVVFSHRFRCPYKPVTLYLYQMLLLYSNEKLVFNSTLQYKEKLNNFQNSYLSPNSSMSHYSFELIPDEITRLFVKFSSINDNSRDNYIQFNYFINNRNILIYNFNDKYNTNKALYEFTQYMITRYPENTEFEKENYVNLEKKYLYKLKYVNETLKEINESFSYIDDRDNNFYKLFFNENNLKNIKEYLEEKDKLSVKTNISKNEKEELEILLNYDGRELEPEWQWVKKISIVYILNEKDNQTINQLKYSLRSIEYFLPWFIGTIFIIVQSINTNLSWLNINNQHIKIINPKDIVSKKIIGKCSKEIIEMYLDRIPFISERFIYLNINHYFKYYIHPRFFFNAEFFPKYNFETSLYNKINITQNIEESFLNTYEVIKDFFGNNYINVRVLIDSPISLYRDLFRPVRKLYLSKFFNTDFKKINLLPMYLLSTYNIYGTSQIYYPNYVAGFGEIRNITPPSIKQSKKISYYGFDITSEIIIEQTIINVDLFRDVNETLSKLEKSKVLFFSINIMKNLGKSEKKLIKKFLRNLYNYKSLFEI